MLEVSRPDGPMVIFRPWTITEMKELMAQLPSPEEASDNFAEALGMFCKEFSPTMHELRQLMSVKLGPMNWYRVSGLIGRDDCRKEYPDWDHADYRAAVLELANTVKTAFPVCGGVTKMNYCVQRKGENVREYYHRLYELFNRHSGMPEPAA